jgi:hypothetical protein
MSSVRTHRSILSSSKKRLRRYQDGGTSRKTKKPSLCSSSSIHVLVNHVPIKVLVDTGAAISLIHAKTLSTMTYTPVVPLSLTDIHTANSGFLSLIGLVKLTVRIKGEKVICDLVI